MGYASLAGRARTSSRNPQAHAICDRCGFRYNRVDLRFQSDWRGTSCVNTNQLVCNKCCDEPQEQLRALTLPQDPVPVVSPRVQDFAAASTDLRQVSGSNTKDPVTGLPIPGGATRTTQDGSPRVTQQTGGAPHSLNQTPGIDPNAPGANNPGLPYNTTSVPQTGPIE